MKKRILSLALTVALLISLIPLAAIPTRAASSFVASDNMIELLKNWEGFSKKPYWDYSQWTVGYGTRVPEGKLAEYQANGIPEDEAEALLQEFLDSMGKSLNSFIDKFGLKLTQGQFDALLSLCYNCGTSWLYKPSTLRTAVIEGWKGDDFLFAFAQWSNCGDETLTGLIRRRLGEADMYLNGSYTLWGPSNHCYVQFNPNGGECEIKVQGFDSNVKPAIRAVPTYEGYVFAGWYTDPTGGEKVTKLDSSVKGYTLYAHWSAGNGGSQSAEQQITGTAVNYVRQIASGTLNSFDQPVKGALVVDAYPIGEVVTIVAEYTDASGTKWGKVSGGGWINLAYTEEFSEDADEDEGPGVSVTVTGSDVNLRRGPSTAYSVIGQADAGDTLEITRTASGSGYTWGKSSKGWIALKYTNYDSVTAGTQKPDEEEEEEQEDTGSGDIATDTKEPVLVTGKVKLSSGCLNIRTGPSTGYTVAGYLNNGQSVEILETKTVGTTIWGRISRGWISLRYVTLDGELPKEEDPSDNDSSTDTDTENNTGSSDNNTDTNTGTGNGNDANTDTDGAITGKIVLTSGKLNIRSGPGTSYSVVGWLSTGDAVTITEQKTSGSMTWGKIAKGWICMTYVKQDAASGGNGNTSGSTGGSGNTSGSTGSSDNTSGSGSSSSATSATGRVSANGSMLRIRSGPGSSYSIAGYLADGAAVEILETQLVGTTTWGRTAKGWISLLYVKLDAGAVLPGAGSEQDKTPETSGTTVTITASCLYIRSGAGSSNKIVGRLYYGESVTVLETKVVGETTWGRIDQGWISLRYAK